MPQIANITVKKADGVTDQVWTVLTPSAGDKVPAIWENLDVGTTKATRPTFRFVATDNGPRTVRRCTASFLWPVSGTDAYGRSVVVDRVPLSATFEVPTNVLLSSANEAVVQFTNLVASALIQQCASSGVAPT